MESLPVLLFKFSSDTFWGASAFFFGSLYRSYLLDKNKTRGSLLLFVAWPTPFEKLTSKCYVRGRKIERGMASHKYIAKQRLISSAPWLAQLLYTWYTLDLFCRGFPRFSPDSCAIIVQEHITLMLMFVVVAVVLFWS